MNRNLIIGLVVFLLLGVGIVGGIMLVDSQKVTGMTITLYDANGNAVWQESNRGNIDFWIGDTSGAEVVRAEVAITFAITSSNDKTISDPSVSGNLYVTECYGNLNVQNAEIDLNQALGAQSVSSGTYTYSLDLTTFLPGQGTTSSIEYGWKVMFKARIDAQATVDGYTLYDTWESDPIIFQLYWNEGAPPSSGTISVDGTIGVSLE